MILGEGIDVAAASFGIRVERSRTDTVDDFETRTLGTITVNIARAKVRTSV